MSNLILVHFLSGQFLNRIDLNIPSPVISGEKPVLHLPVRPACAYNLSLIPGKEEYFHFVEKQG